MIDWEDTPEKFNEEMSELIEGDELVPTEALPELTDAPTKAIPNDHLEFDKVLRAMDKFQDTQELPESRVERITKQIESNLDILRAKQQAKDEKSTFSIKDSGQRREFSTGAQRDRGDIKPRPDLIHPYFLMRLGLHLAKGAEKYSAWNWSKGMPLSDWFASLYRHVVQAMSGDESEDHLSAICFNAMGAMVTQAGIRAGIYPKELDDMSDLQLARWSKLIDALINVLPDKE
jgi:hypothetical protein